jgi:hypothetical protein
MKDVREVTANWNFLEIDAEGVFHTDVNAYKF